MVINHQIKRFAARLKYLLTLIVLVFLLTASVRVFAQAPPQPPPPPPPPGGLLKKINPFKKHKDTTTNKKDTSKAKQTHVNSPPGLPPGAPPPPPNPLNLFKKKSKDTSKTTPPAGH